MLFRSMHLDLGHRNKVVQELGHPGNSSTCDRNLGQIAPGVEHIHFAIDNRDASQGAARCAVDRGLEGKDSWVDAAKIPMHMIQFGRSSANDWDDLRCCLTGSGRMGLLLRDTKVSVARRCHRVCQFVVCLARPRRRNEAWSMENCRSNLVAGMMVFVAECVSVLCRETDKVSILSCSSGDGLYL